MPINIPKPTRFIQAGYKPVEGGFDKKEEAQQETSRERAARHRQERRAELTFDADDEARWRRNRNRVIAERQQAAQAAYDFTKPEWDHSLKEDMKTYLEKNQYVVVIYSLDDAVFMLKALAEKYGKTLTEIGLILTALKKVGKDTYSAVKIAKSFGDFGLKVKPFLDKKGNERISISTKNQSVKHVISDGIRVKINSKKSYSVSNPKVIQTGVSPKARTGSYKGGFIVSFVISATINTKDIIFDNDFYLCDWLGNVGSDLFKTAISIGGGELSLLLLPTLPFIAEAFVCAFVGASLIYLYDHFEVDQKILSGLGYEE